MVNLSKINWLTIVLVIAICIAGVFVYQWWQAKGELTRQIGQNENLMKQVDELQKEIGKLEKEIEELKISEEKAIEKTAGWKTYKNEFHRFEIKYPGEWKVKDKLFGERGQVSFLKEPSSDVGFSIGINIYAEHDGGGYDITEGEEVIVEDRVIRPFIYHYPIGNLISFEMCLGKDSESAAEACAEEVGNFYYQFSFYCGREDSKEEIEINECNKLFNQIIFTFQFIEK
ncbi:hypothetical protein COS61_01070 [Candidatus Wolfebacteria bacterium CG03_land_8_20_14_0_80_40_12]|uniref:Uncharacterized protein n=1 Tax=Candidatus Wolfebacteria bacterium CG03_land_8_20_14_0_80_40_12 TaxID=1975069 RepID=A0A2M7B5X4_9BACT|nr:MAG: hypothetical protein COS61_01070 [Candidatus Wolfebacteria bacterium CG03_land_8_20_14_0_80_40_12]